MMNIADSMETEKKPMTYDQKLVYQSVKATIQNALKENPGLWPDHLQETPDHVKVTKALELLKLIYSEDIELKIIQLWSHQISVLNDSNVEPFDILGHLICFVRGADVFDIHKTTRAEFSIGNLPKLSKEELVDKFPRHFEHFFNLSINNLISDPTSDIPKLNNPASTESEPLLNKLTNDDLKALVTGLVVRENLPKITKSAKIRFYYHALLRSLRRVVHLDPEDYFSSGFCLLKLGQGLKALDSLETYWKLWSEEFPTSKKRHLYAENINSLDNDSYMEVAEVKQDILRIACLLKTDDNNEYNVHVAKAVSMCEKYIKSMMDPTRTALHLHFKYGEDGMNDFAQFVGMASEGHVRMGDVKEKSWKKAADCYSAAIKMVQGKEFVTGTIPDLFLLRCDRSLNQHRYPYFDQVLHDTTSPQLIQLYNNENLTKQALTNPEAPKPLIGRFSEYLGKGTTQLAPYSQPQNLGDLKNSKIIVDQSIEKNLVNSDGQFVVNNLDSAVKIAKDGNTIFLKKGVYAPIVTIDDCHVLLLNRGVSVTIVGEASSLVTFRGSIHKMGGGVVTFKNIFFELRDGDYCFLTDGGLKFEFCKVDASNSNNQGINKTCFFLAAQDVKSCPDLRFQFCTISGEGTCQKVITVTGSTSSISIQNSVIENVESVIVTELDENTNVKKLRVSLKDSCIRKISKNFIKLVIKPLHLPGFRSDHSNFHVNDVAVTVERCFIEAGTGSGIHLKNVEKLTLKSNYIRLHDLAGEKVVTKCCGNSSHTAKHQGTIIHVSNIRCVNATQNHVEVYDFDMCWKNLSCCLNDSNGPTAFKITGFIEVNIRRNTIVGFHNALDISSFDHNDKAFFGVFDTIFINCFKSCLLGFQPSCSKTKDHQATSQFVFSGVRFQEVIGGIILSCTLGKTDLELDIIQCKFFTVPYPISLPNPKEKALKYSLTLENIQYTETNKVVKSRKERRARVIEELMRKSGMDPQLTLEDLESLHSKKVLEIASTDDEKLAGNFLRVVRNVFNNNYDSEVD